MTILIDQFPDEVAADVSDQLDGSLASVSEAQSSDDATPDELRRQLTATESDLQSPRERFDAALDRIDDHLDDPTTDVPATGTPADDC
jgi:hypothetical protein